MARLFWVWAAWLSFVGAAWPAPAAAEEAAASCGLPDDGFQGLRRTDPFERGQVVLTFDDGPQPAPTKKLLDALDEQRLPATFFVVGLWIRSSTYQLIQRMAASGYEIGTHTYSHDEQLTRRGWGVDYVEGQYALTHVLVELALLATSPEDFDQLYRRAFERKPGRPLSPAQVRARWRAIERNHLALLAERGFDPEHRVYRMLFARPPGGIPYEGRWPKSMRDEHEAALRRLGLLNVLWHGISGDTVLGRLNDSEFLQRNVRFYAKRGGILLMHDRMRRDALAAALARLAQDPSLHVTSLRSAVSAKYSCEARDLYAALHPPSALATRE
jgi:peptidoglycan/xylan/chitin deacetylase (PgdA/CDA1 family)